MKKKELYEIIRQEEIRMKEFYNKETVTRPEPKLSSEKEEREVALALRQIQSGTFSENEFRKMLRVDFIENGRTPAEQKSIDTIRKTKAEQKLMKNKTK